MRVVHIVVVLAVLGSEAFAQIPPVPHADQLQRLQKLPNQVPMQQTATPDELISDSARRYRTEFGAGKETLAETFHTALVEGGFNPNDGKVLSSSTMSLVEFEDPNGTSMVFGEPDGTGRLMLTRVYWPIDQAHPRVWFGPQHLPTGTVISQQAQPPDTVLDQLADPPGTNIIRDPSLGSPLNEPPPAKPNTPQAPGQTPAQTPGQAPAQTPTPAPAPAPTPAPTTPQTPPPTTPAPRAGVTPEHPAVRLSGMPDTVQPVANRDVPPEFMTDAAKEFRSAFPGQPGTADGFHDALAGAGFDVTEGTITPTPTGAIFSTNTPWGHVAVVGTTNPDGTVTLTKAWQPQIPGVGPMTFTQPPPPPPPLPPIVLPQRLPDGFPGTGGGVLILPPSSPDEKALWGPNGPNGPIFIPNVQPVPAPTNGVLPTPFEPLQPLQGPRFNWPSQYAPLDDVPAMIIEPTTGQPFVLPKLHNSTLRNNTAGTTGSSGGGIELTPAPPTLNNSTLEGNTPGTPAPNAGPAPDTRQHIFHTSPHAKQYFSGTSHPAGNLGLMKSMPGGVNVINSLAPATYDDRFQYEVITIRMTVTSAVRNGLNLLRDWLLRRPQAIALASRSAGATFAQSKLPSSSSTSGASAVALLLTSTGNSTGEAFRAQVLGDGPVDLDLTAVAAEPLKGVRPEAIVKASSAFAARGAESATAIGYCLEFLRQPPSAGMLYRIAPEAIQKRFESLRKVADAARVLGDAGQLRPDSDPKSFLHSMTQWAIWSSEQKFTQDGFTKAFVDHTRKAVEGSGRPWQRDFAQAVEKAAPGRWQQIQRILRFAGV